LNSPDDHDYILTEQGTDKYADLSMVQAVALPAVAQALVTAIRARTDNGQAEATEETTKSHDDQD
jgi:hypothetical protein